MQRYRREYCEAVERVRGLAMARKQADAGYGEWKGKRGSGQAR